MIGGEMAGMEMAVSEPKCLIGRGKDCDIRLPRDMISRKHCMILNEGSILVEDCGSVNGTLVNGEPIRQRHELKNGDWITMGTLNFEIRLLPDDKENAAENRVA
jgi:pSer/pThr/pTyr-binding forkhead associated (FHA) protein